MISSAEAARMIRALLRRDRGLRVEVEFVDSERVVTDRISAHPASNLLISRQAIAFLWCFGNRPHGHRVQSIQCRGCEWVIEVDGRQRLIIGPLRTERDWDILREWKRKRPPKAALQELRRLFAEINGVARQDRASQRRGPPPQWTKNLGTPGVEAPLPGRLSSRTGADPHTPTGSEAPPEDHAEVAPLCWRAADTERSSPAPERPACAPESADAATRAPAPQGAKRND